MNLQKKFSTIGILKNHISILYFLTAISCSNLNSFKSLSNQTSSSLNAVNSPNEHNGNRVTNGSGNDQVNGTANGLSSGSGQNFFNSLFAGTAFAQTAPKTLTCASGFYLQGIDQNGQLICQALPACTAASCPTSPSASATTGAATAKTCTTGSVFLGLDASGNPLCSQNPQVQVFQYITVSNLTDYHPSCVANTVEIVSSTCDYNNNSPLTGSNGYQDANPCRSFSSPCNSAAHRYCNDQGYATGMVVDHGDPNHNPAFLTVHCIWPTK